MEFRLLGPLEVSDGDRALPLGGPKQRTVLAHLLLGANSLVTVERLIDALWRDDPPMSARNTLQTYIKHLRKLVGAERIEHLSSGYRFEVDARELDMLRFESLVDEARQLATSDTPGAVSRLREALGLWRGPALDDLSEQPSLRPQIARLEEMRTAAIEERMAADLALGRHRDLIPELEAMLARQPYRERSWGHLMVALYRSGRQGDALATYLRARDVLSDELGIDPSPELQHLQEQILKQDPGLETEGETLRGYRLLEQLGEGAFGVVHRAYQPDVGREVAVKVIHPRLANHPEFIRRFTAEAQLVARLEHPHIVPLYDYWRDPDGAYLVMRYLRGGNLREAIAGGPLDLSRAVSVTDQVARALAAAHRQGVVHRDVQPANVLFDEDGNAYLSDFGIAKDLATAEVMAEGGAPGEFAYYMSPEEARGDEATQRADIYSLGLVFYECLAGRHAFGDTLSDELIAKRTHDPVPPLNSARPDLPASLDLVVAKAVAEEPAERYPDTLAFVAALREALGPVTALTRAVECEVRNPYKGLRPFLEADAADFFGREDSIDELLVRTKEGPDGARFLAVVGPSGCGKSSLVRAGLVPALRHGGLPGSESWFSVDMHPGDQPFEELASALSRLVIGPPSEIAARLAHDRNGLPHAVDEILPAGDAELVLVIDQFEEIFTLVAGEDVRTRFLDAVVAAATAPGSRIHVVLTLRADFYDRPLLYKEFGDLLASHTYAVTPLSASEIEVAVSGPAGSVGVAAGPGLIGEVVAGVAGRPGALPLLQFAVTELFEERADSTLTLDAYRALGGVSGALARGAEGLYDEMGTDAQGAARQLFLRLVELGEEGSQDTRRRALRSELTSLDVDRHAMESAIDTFGSRRLLSFDRDPESRAPTVEVAHEALLTEWGRLRGWIEAAREDIHIGRRLAVGAAEWEQAGRDDSFLLRGANLQQTAAWSTSTGLALAHAERGYLEASLELADVERSEDEERRTHEIELERRSVHRLRALVAVLTVAGLVAATLTVIATNRGTEAQSQARIASARELAAASVANLELDPELSVLLAMESIDQTRAVDGSVLPETEDALHRAVGASRIEQTVSGVGGVVAWGPNGTFAAESAKGTGVVEIRDPETGRRLRSLEAHDGAITGLAFSGDGTTLATAGADGRLKLWDPSTGDLRYSIRGTGKVLVPTFSSDDTRVGAQWRGNVTTVRIARVSTGRVVQATQVPQRPLAFSPDLRSVADLGNIGRSLVIIRLDTGQRSETRAAATSVSWSPDGRYVAAVHWSGGDVFDATGRHLFGFGFEEEFVESLAWSSDSGRLVIGGHLTATMWQIGRAGAEELLSLPHQLPGSIEGLAFSPDGRRLITAAADTSAVKIWDVSISGDEEVANIPAAEWHPDVAFMPDGGRVARLVDGRRAVAIWDLGAERTVRRFGPPRNDLFGGDTSGQLAVSPDGRSIVTLGGGVAEVWDVASGRRTLRISDHKSIYGANWSPDAQHLILADTHGWVKIVDRTAREIDTLREDDVYEVVAATFSPDGRFSAMAARPDGKHPGLEPRTTIWDRERGEVVTTIGVDAIDLFFSPDGARIVTVSEDLQSNAEVWDTRSGERLEALPGQVTQVAFSPDGTRIAATSTDSAVRIYDANSFELQLVLRGHVNGSSWVQFSPDSTMLVTGGRGGIVRVWALDIDDLVQIAGENVTRQLTDEECRQYLHVATCLAPIPA